MSEQIVNLNVKPNSMGHHQWNWHEKIRELNANDADYIEFSKKGRPDTDVTERNANKWLVAKLREYADKIESDDYPRVFGFDLKENEIISTLSVTLSYPWGG